MSWVRLGSTVVGALAMLAGCNGNINVAGKNVSPGDGTSGGNGPGSGPGSGPGGVVGTKGGLNDPGSVVMHRLNVTEYNNTVRDLLGTALTLPSSFPPDDTAYGFDNVAQTLTVTDVHIGSYQATAKLLAAEALTAAHRAKVLPCDVATLHAACVTTAMTAFLPKAWRRPVTASEVADLVALYSASLTQGMTDDDAMTQVLTAVLLAPDFIFRIEPIGATTVGAPAAIRKLDGYEVASRLSYFLWSSMPDDALFAAAKNGDLMKDQSLQSQVRRMLADNKAQGFISSFGGQWLPVRQLDSHNPDLTVFKTFDESLRSAMKSETLGLFGEVMSGALPVNQMLTANFSYMNDRLAKHYGLPAVNSATPVKTPVPAGRGGLLTNASFLTSEAHPNETAPVLRGKWVLNQILCQDVPPPPPNVPTEPPAAGGVTRKQRLAAHRVEAACAICHGQMDPIGLGLEQYDGIGAARTTDSGVAIDPSGTLPDGRTFANPQDLGAMLAADPSVARCVTEHVFIYGVSRAVRLGSSDDTLIDSVTKSFVSGGQKMPALVESIAMSTVFRQRVDEPLTAVPGVGP